MHEDGNRIVIRKTAPAFSKEQKLGFSLVVGIGSLALVIGVFYLGSHVTQAFNIEYDGPEVLTTEQRQARALEELQKSDTDGDGLTDYEELYLYRTSPYLSDTDSDGVSDSLELAANTDPNCAGSDCALTVEEYDRNSSLNAGIEAPGSEVLNDNLALIEELVGGVTPDQVRTFLRESGVSQELLDGYSDEQIMELYRNVIQDLDESGELIPLLAEEAEQQSLQ